MQPPGSRTTINRLTINRWTINRWTIAGTVLGLTLACGQAFAQYVWTDEKGVRQYSDRPPPASVPDSRIIKGKFAAMPGAMPVQGNAIPAATAGGPAQASAANAPAAAAASAAPSLAERNADFNKRRTARAETEKKQAEQARLAEEKRVNCERAASYQRTLESGVRMARIDARGEKVFPTEEEKARDLAETKRVLEDCKA